MKRTNEKGITLIALIITIIILLVLATVTINVIIDGAVTDEASGLVDKIKDHDDTMAGIKDDVRNLIRPGTTGDDIVDEPDEPDVPDEPEVTNNPPTVTTSVTSTGAKTATIIATGSDADGDTLTYVLKIGGTTYQPSSTSTNSATFNVTGLKAHTSYSYEATVSDGIATGKNSGTFTTNNTPPQINSVDVSNQTTSSLTITASASDEDGDSLTYTLTINGSTYSNSKTWNVLGLSEGQSYYYIVTVTDGYNSIEYREYAKTVELCDTCRRK